MNRCFGREEEINRLSAALKDTNGRITIVSGPRGVGKTTVVKETLSRLHPIQPKKWFARSKPRTGIYVDLCGVDLHGPNGGEAWEDRRRARQALVTAFTTAAGIEFMREDNLPFDFRDHLQSLAKHSRGILPTLVIDNAHELLHFEQHAEEGLFQLFLAWTRESNLCHVVLVSSDSHSMDLTTRRSHYFRRQPIWHFNEETAKAFMETELQIGDPITRDLLWQLYGGAVFDLTQAQYAQWQPLFETLDSLRGRLKTNRDPGTVQSARRAYKLLAESPKDCVDSFLIQNAVGHDELESLIRKNYVSCVNMEGMRISTRTPCELLILRCMFAGHTLPPQAQANAAVMEHVASLKAWADNPDGARVAGSGIAAQPSSA